MIGNIIPAGMIGSQELILIVVVVVLLFGARKIPDLMRGVGRGVKEFKDAVNTDYSKETKKDTAKEEEKKEEDKPAE